MTELDRRILTAQGYMELGLFEDAHSELVSLPKEAWDRPEVMETWVLLQMGEQHWQAALDMCRRLIELQPKVASAYIHAAYCMHEMGQTREALEFLQNGPRSLHSKSVYFYNLGCYCAKLGKMDEARVLLEKSFEIDNGLRRVAKKDPDLADLRSQLL
jgi:predicted Zn-dependent protease